MKKYFAIIICFLMLNVVGSNACSAAPPLKVAILPVYVDTYYVAEDARIVIEKALTDKFPTTAAGILPGFEVIPRQDLTPALPKAPQEGKQKIRLDKANLVGVAEKLGADIVIVAEVKSYYTFVYPTREGETMRQISFFLRLLSYHRPSDEYIDKTDHLYYTGADYHWVEPANVAKQLIDSLLRKVPDYRQK